MTLTEEEAKTKICQESMMPTILMSRKDVPGDWAFSAKNCVGSACMAWRWESPIDYEIGNSLPEGVIPDDPGWEICETFYVADQKKNRWRRPKLHHGYCGKAGHP